MPSVYSLVASVNSVKNAEDQPSVKLAPTICGHNPHDHATKVLPLTSQTKLTLTVTLTLTDTVKLTLNLTYAHNPRTVGANLTNVKIVIAVDWRSTCKAAFTCEIKLKQVAQLSLHHDKQQIFKN